MWKFFALFLVTCFTSVEPQNLNVECVFQLNEFDEYSCELYGITVTDPSADVVFTGTHVESKNNDDVFFVHILNSTTPFIIEELFTTFPNLVDLTITRSGLETVNIPESAQLLFLDLFDNNITYLEANSFRNQSSLIFCFLQFNKIAEIDENAFNGLANLQFLDFSENLIASLAPRTFSPLTQISYISFMDNFVTSIDAELFSQNTQIGSINMSFNRINAISPRFGDNIRESSQSIFLIENACVDGYFAVANDQGWNDMINDLQTCFNNFNNGTEVQRITMEFTGPLTIMDESGNVLVRINH